MKVLLALVGGYLVGARAGSRDFDQLTKSFRAVYESEEFEELLTAVRSHAGHTLRELADVLDRGSDMLPTNDLVERVRQLAARD
jgi:uncharacterized membrane protein YfbV (UPF0208 family)